MPDDCHTAPVEEALRIAFREGQRAAFESPEAPNPYPWQSANFGAWLRGFFAAATPPPVIATEPGLAPLPPPFLTLPTPGFHTQYPAVLNRDKIDPGSLAAMEVAWKQGDFPAGSISFHRLHNVYVVQEGMVFDANLRLLQGTDADTTAGAPDHARQMISTVRDKGQIAYYPGRTVLCKKAGSFNYGHFLLEMFTRAQLAQQLPDIGQPFFLLHRAGAALLHSAYGCLASIDIGLDQILFSTNEPTLHEELIVVQGLTRHGQYMSCLAAATANRLGAGVAPGRYEKLMVLRENAHWRVLENQHHLAAALAPHGYVAIDPGSMTLAEQIALFKGARRLVGAAGAAFTNLVFCEPGARVALLSPADFPDTFFWFLSNHRELEYLDIRCDQVPPTEGQRWDGTFTVADSDIAALIEFLEK